MSKKKPIEINIKDKITIIPESIYQSQVVAFGNGAIIRSYKKFIGKGVTIIIGDDSMQPPWKKKLSKKEVEKGEDLTQLDYDLSKKD